MFELTVSAENPMGTNGFAFIEFATEDVEGMCETFRKMGFAIVGKHKTQHAFHLQQGDIHFIVNAEPNSMAARFARLHGPSVSAMGFVVKDADFAYQRAKRLGARAYQGEFGTVAVDVPAIFGIGESLIYFMQEERCDEIYTEFFNPVAYDTTVSVGLTYLDHVTHNVFRDHMDTWAEYYQRLFNFRQIRYFDIKGDHTGLISRAMTSPCGKIRIPLNESTDAHSQIEEYLQQYNGEGIQHIALASADIYHSVPAMRLRGMQFLTVPQTYYHQVDERIPGHDENLMLLEQHQILIDGSVEKDEGILLQIFTSNQFGPVFFEIIQRKRNESFGEGNFRALFVAMEMDQIQRGVLKPKG